MMESLIQAESYKVEPDDDDALIACMSRIGENRFFWPLCRDEAWYMRPDILGIIRSQPPLGGLVAINKYMALPGNMPANY